MNRGSKKKIQWHPGFYGGLELTLRDYKNSLEFITEHELSKKPIRVDMLIIRKEDNTKIEDKIGAFFRKHNIVEYKSPDDELTIDVFYKVIGYAGVYIGLNGLECSLTKDSDANKKVEITISIFRHRKPVKLFADLKNLGAKIEKYYDGIYYISGIINIPVQLVVIGELPQKEYITLRALSPKLSEAEAVQFVLSSQKYTESYDRQNADAVLQVSIAANMALYEAIKEDYYMCEALENLMKDKLEESKNEGRKEGIIEGKREGIIEGKREGIIEGKREGIIEGALSTLYDLVKQGLLDIKNAALQANMSEAAFMDGMKKYRA